MNGALRDDGYEWSRMATALRALPLTLGRANAAVNTFLVMLSGQSKWQKSRAFDPEEARSSGESRVRQTANRQLKQAACREGNGYRLQGASINSFSVVCRENLINRACHGSISEDARIYWPAGALVSRHADRRVSRFCPCCRKMSDTICWKKIRISPES